MDVAARDDAPVTDQAVGGVAHPPPGAPAGGRERGLQRAREQERHVGAIRGQVQASEGVVNIMAERIYALDLASALNLSAFEGSGLLEIPDFANARGLREAGVTPPR